MSTSRREPSESTSWSAIRMYQDLMQQRVRHILLVSSLYDSFILTEDGLLNEAILRQFVDLNLTRNPDLIRVSSGAEAIAMAKEEGRFDMIITSLQVGDMNAADLARGVKQAGLDLPVVLLAYSNRDLNEFLHRHGRGDLDRIFLWQGDVGLLLAMVKDLEDRRNAAHDTGEMGVPAILVVEDNIRFYSSFLPVIYAELMKHSQQLLSEGLNLSQKMLRMRARPKILLCESFEEAWDCFERYGRNILGILTDFEFPRAGRLDRRAGVELVSRVHATRADIPIVMQSSLPENEEVARGLDAAFLLKGSPLLLRHLRELLLRHLGFGDFIFRMPDGTEIDKARDLRSLVKKIKSVPAESLAFHGERNHFSMWLKARSEFSLAERLRPRKVADFPTLEDLRRNLIESITAYRRVRERTVVADFDRGDYLPTLSLARIGGGSLGGKARGLAFVTRLLSVSEVASHFPEVDISVPPAVVIGTDLFDQFLEEGKLADFALGQASETDLELRFAQAELPRGLMRDLRVFLQRVTSPLAVRSSGLLEDSPSHPLAGIYRTVMIPNKGSLQRRMSDLVAAVKSVYASTFSPQAKAFLQMTPFRLEEEKMAVIIQKVVGTAHGDRFYPDFAGVVRSHNVYASPPLKPDDGLASVALGLGRTVVAGGCCVQFSPRHPRRVTSFSSVDELVESSQREFLALDLSRRSRFHGPEGAELTRFGLEEAEADGTLAAVGSTYSPHNQAVHDGIAREGVRLVTFAPVLKQKIFPLASLLEELLAIGRRGTGSDVEIEFAVNLAVEEGALPEFGFLQMRRLALAVESGDLEIGEVSDADLICRSRSVLGHGRVSHLRDLVVVDYHRFDRLRSLEVADDVARLNAALQEAGTPYLLIGVGRWGSLDRHLGVPVTWNQIAGARVIVESGFRDMRVTPSQGTHFFQNLSSLNVGYVTVNPEAGDGFVDWEWIAAQPAITDTGFVRHVRLERPVTVVLNGRTGEGVILKPGARTGREPQPDDLTESLV